MNIKRKWIFKGIAFALFFFCVDVYAFNIVGTWKLLSIEKKDSLKNHVWIPDCRSPTGLLIYSKEGYMAAGVNCMKPDNPSVVSFVPKDMTFYSGKYTVNQNKIIHYVENSSDPAYYGKSLERTFDIINNDQIYLTVKGKSGKLVRLKWLRINEK